MPMPISLLQSFLLISSFLSLELTLIKAHNSNTSTSSSSSPSSRGDGPTPFSSKRIPGCPDLESFQRFATFDSLSASQLGRISCLCGPVGHGREDFGEDEEETKEREEERQAQNEEAASVTCIYGSTLADLEHTLGLAKVANKSIERIVLNHVEIGADASLMEILLSSELSELRHLEVKKCRGQPLDLSQRPNMTTKGGFEGLEGLVLEECEMCSMPSAILSRAPRVKHLSLAGNKIQAIHRDDLAACKQSLESLNLAGNLLPNSGVEPGALSQLEALRNLEIGEHNFASVVLLEEIGQLASLETLDMSQMDGLEGAEQFASFKNTSKLKRLTLTGCNLKALNGSAFGMFPALEWLDLRVNLIEQLEGGCFAGLNSLRSLSLAGNFLRELPVRLWADLPQLENLDLGWNDFRTLNQSSFSGMSGERLERLNLRNNEALRHIAPGTFDGLTGLRYLNLSTTALGQVGAGIFGNLTRLKELDLSASNLSSIDPVAFDGLKPSLELLNLANNNLKQFDPRLLLGMDSLRLLDLFENRWICDEKMQAVANWLDEAYKRAAVEKRDFEFRHGLGAICDRPYSRRGDSIFDLIGLDPKELAYDEGKDTTTMGPVTTTIAREEDGGGVLLGGSENSTFDWKAITLLVGSEGDEHVNFTALLEEERSEDAKKPRYDINVVKYGQKSVTRREANTWLSGVIVTLLVVTTAFCIIVVARRGKNSSGAAEQPGLDEKEEELLRRRIEFEKGQEKGREEKDLECCSSHSPEKQSPKASKSVQNNQNRPERSASLRLPNKTTTTTDTDLEQNCATTTF